MFRRFRDFERRYVVNFNADPGAGDPGKEGGDKDKGGAGGAGQKTDDVQALKDKIAALEKEKADWSSKDVTLNDKVRREREDLDKKAGESKALEAALTFTLTKDEFLKQHESILPKGASEIFKVADKEKFDSPIDKANEIKVGLIDLHFSQQSNVDFLTDDKKEELADYSKLTKNGKKEKSNEIYRNIFLPAIDTMKRVKKAEELAKAKHGFGGDTDADQALKDKMIGLGQKKFFRGKN